MANSTAKRAKATRRPQRKRQDPLVLRSIYLPASLDERLRQQAFDTGRSKNDLIRELLKKAIGVDA